MSDVAESDRQQFKPLAACIERHVIVLGPTGSGKSTVLNMLFNDDVTRDACTGPSLVNFTSSSVTKDTTYFFNVKSRMALIDTVGFGDPNLSLEQIVHKTRTFLNNASIGVNTVIIVAKFPRVTAEDRVNLRALDVLFTRGWKKNAVLVLTHYPGEFSESGEEEAKDLQSWMKDDEEVQGIVQKFGKIIVTENNTSRKMDEKSYRPFRERCLKDLKDFVGKSKENFFPAPVGFSEIMQAILKIFSDVFWKKPKQWIGDVAQYLTKGNIPSCAGECSICVQAIPIDSLVVTECSHIFHRDCILQWLVRNQSCPSCRMHEPVCYANGPSASAASPSSVPAACS